MSHILATRVLSAAFILISQVLKDKCRVILNRFGVAETEETLGHRHRYHIIYKLSYLFVHFKACDIIIYKLPQKGLNKYKVKSCH